MQNNTSSAAIGLAVGILGSLALAAATAAVTLTELQQQDNDYLHPRRVFSYLLPTTTPTAPPPPPPRKKQDFASISPRGEYWWQLSNAHAWLELPQSLLDSPETLLLWQAQRAHQNNSGSMAQFENVVEALVQSNRCPREAREQISRDLPRTFPTDEYFADAAVQDSMMRVLSCVCVEYPKLGYVQSMNFLCSFLFLHCKTEDACFAVFRVLIESPELNLQDMYAPGLPQLFRVLHAFDILLDKHAPRAVQRMRQVNLDLVMFAQTWFMTLFTYSMDWAVLGPVWDLVFQRGWEAVLRVAVCLVQQHEEEITRGAGADFDQIGHLMRNACANAPPDLAQRAADELKFDDDDLAICAQVAGST